MSDLDYDAQAETCDDPRCRIPEHRASKTAGWMTDTERLILRNTLLANEDMGLTAAEATAVAYVIKPAVERIVQARLLYLAQRAEAAEDLRRWLLEWIDDQRQMLPEHRTPAAHGKLDLLRDLHAALDPNADQ